MPIELVADISVKHYIVLANNLIFLNSLVGILRSAEIDLPFYFTAGNLYMKNFSPNSISCLLSQLGKKLQSRSVHLV